MPIVSVAEMSLLMSKGYISSLLSSPQAADAEVLPFVTGFNSELKQVSLSLVEDPLSDYSYANAAVDAACVSPQYLVMVSPAEFTVNNSEGKVARTMVALVAEKNGGVSVAVMPFIQSGSSVVFDEIKYIEKWNETSSTNHSLTLRAAVNIRADVDGEPIKMARKLAMDAAAEADLPKNIIDLLFYRGTSRCETFAVTHLAMRLITHTGSTFMIHVPPNAKGLLGGQGLLPANAVIASPTNEGMGKAVTYCEPLLKHWAE